MISHEDTILTRLVERHDVDALIIVPFNGGAVSQLLMEKFMGIFAGPDRIAQRLSIDSERHSALVLQITAALPSPATPMRISEPNVLLMKTKRHGHWRLNEASSPSSTSSGGRATSSRRSPSHAQSSSSPLSLLFFSPGSFLLKFHGPVAPLRSR